MIDILEPENLSYTIHDYKQQTTAIIRELQARGSVPIIVGGTNYYVDCMIWDSLIPIGDANSKPPPDRSVRNLVAITQSLPGFKLHSPANFK